DGKGEQVNKIIESTNSDLQVERNQPIEYSTMPSEEEASREKVMILLNKIFVGKAKRNSTPMKKENSDLHVEEESFVVECQITKMDVDFQLVVPSRTTIQREQKNKSDLHPSEEAKGDLMEELAHEEETHMDTCVKLDGKGEQRNKIIESPNSDLQVERNQPIEYSTMLSEEEEASREKGMTSIEQNICREGKEECKIEQDVSVQKQ
ncbi:hypothetical protein KI387_005957, partial [Taxus chinensis]